MLCYSTSNLFYRNDCYLKQNDIEMIGNTPSKRAIYQTRETAVINDRYQQLMAVSTTNSKVRRQQTNIFTYCTWLNQVLSFDSFSYERKQNKPLTFLHRETQSCKTTEHLWTMELQYATWSENVKWMRYVAIHFFMSEGNAQFNYFDWKKEKKRFKRVRSETMMF